LEVIMQAVKARRQGNATVVTLPSALKIPEGREYYVINNEDGSILLIPKVANPYSAALDQGATLRQADEWEDEQPRGREAL
jgi:antitoxin component of MazEF toxin-antitoxin module